MLKKYEKWFEFDNDLFYSKKKVKTLRESWIKTLYKWEIILEWPELLIWNGKTPNLCGLCNLYFSPRVDSCSNCPICAITGETCCSGTPLFTFSEESTATKKAELEYLFLLFVKEATFNNKW